MPHRRHNRLLNGLCSSRQGGRLLQAFHLLVRARLGAEAEGRRHRPRPAPEAPRGRGRGPARAGRGGRTPLRLGVALGCSPLLWRLLRRALPPRRLPLAQPWLLLHLLRHRRRWRSARGTWRRLPRLPLLPPLLLLGDALQDVDHLSEQAVKVAPGYHLVETGRHTRAAQILLPVCADERRKPEAPQQLPGPLAQAAVEQRRQYVIVIGDVRGEGQAPEQRPRTAAQAASIQVLRGFEGDRDELLPEGGLGSFPQRVELELDHRQTRDHVLNACWPAHRGQTFDEVPGAAEGPDEPEEASHGGPGHEWRCAHDEIQQHVVLFEDAIVHIEVRRQLVEELEHHVDAGEHDNVKAHGEKA
mmetsp:Transcript_55925/g.158616  ORF Transcript_55925/g.158616 Transcript_55925/m.158616 type:complete len:358 (-) Transcript_55925:1575-2648(-)